MSSEQEKTSKPPCIACQGHGWYLQESPSPAEVMIKACLQCRKFVSGAEATRYVADRARRSELGQIQLAVVMERDSSGSYLHRVVAAPPGCEDAESEAHKIFAKVIQDWPKDSEQSWTIEELLTGLKEAGWTLMEGSILWEDEIDVPETES